MGTAVEGNASMEREETPEVAHLTMANEDYLECIVRIECEDKVDAGQSAEELGIRSVEIAPPYSNLC